MFKQEKEGIRHCGDPNTNLDKVTTKHCFISADALYYYLLPASLVSILIALIHFNLLKKV